MTVETPQEKRAIRAVFAGGGTGGHIMPALAVAQTLRAQQPEAQILYIGTADRMESTIVPAAGFDFKTISVHGLAGRWTPAGLLKRLLGVVEIASGLPIWQSMRLLRKFRPDVVVGTGGYVCGPVLCAAWLLKIPAVLVEQNEEIGVTSRMVAGFIKAAVVISEKSGKFFRQQGVRTEAVGNPVRPAVIDTTPAEGRKALKLDEGRSVLSIVGGSLGATPVNDAVSGALRELAKEAWFRDGWQVAHQVGARRGGGLSEEEVQELGLHYHQWGYLDEVHNLLAASDLIISRAGGTFLAEIAARGIPMVLVPGAWAANDHQTRNAAPFAEAGAAVVITDAELSAERMLVTLRELLPDLARRQRMALACRKLGHPEAASKIVKILFELAKMI